MESSFAGDTKDYPEQPIEKTISAHVVEVTRMLREERFRHLRRKLEQNFIKPTKKQDPPETKK